VGHVAIALPNYKIIFEEVECNGEITFEHKYQHDGTFTIYDKWPDGWAGNGAMWYNFAKNIQAYYKTAGNNKYTYEELLQIDEYGNMPDTRKGVVAESIIHFMNLIFIKKTLFIRL